MSELELKRLIVVLRQRNLALEDVACRMAQELQELIDDGIEGGSEMGATQALLADWEEVYGLAGNKRWEPPGGGDPNALQRHDPTDDSSARD